MAAKKGKRASLSVAGSNARARHDLQKLRDAENQAESEPVTRSNTGTTVRTTMMTFRITHALAEELRGASQALKAKGLRGDQANIVRKGLEAKLKELRDTHNGGKPFPRVAATQKDSLPDI